jgi:hypothetical protein
MAFLDSVRCPGDGLGTGSVPTAEADGEGGAPGVLPAPECRAQCVGAAGSEDVLAHFDSGTCRPDPAAASPVRLEPACDALGPRTPVRSSSAVAPSTPPLTPRRGDQAEAILRLALRTRLRQKLKCARMEHIQQVETILRGDRPQRARPKVLRLRNALKQRVNRLLVTSPAASLLQCEAPPGKSCRCLTMCWSVRP